MVQTGLPNSDLYIFLEFYFKQFSNSPEISVPKNVRTTKSFISVNSIALCEIRIQSQFHIYDRMSTMKTVISVRNKSTIGNGSCLLTWFTLLHFKHVLVSGWISFKNKTPIFHFLVYFMKFAFKNIPPYNLTQLITEPSQQFSTLASFYSTVDFSSLFESESLNRLWVILDRKLVFLTFLVSLIE